MSAPASRWVRACIVITACAAGIGSNNPLFITPYLKSGEIAKARRLAKNPPFIDFVESYSGLLTVDEEKGTNMFFWYFPAEYSSGKEPLVVWLQGGPGSSSMFGALVINGPYELDRYGKLRKTKRRFRWTKKHHMLYIDNPAGVGYSFTNPGTVPTNQNQVGKHLISAVHQFLQLFPYLRKRPFYASGESYAGKYVPALAHAIHVHNAEAEAKDKIKLVGVAIGNGLIDPINMMIFPEHQYQLGLIDDFERKDMKKRCGKIVQDIRKRKWSDASERFREMFWNSKTQPPNLLTNNTGFTFHFNILVEYNDGMSKAVSKFMKHRKTRKALHVGHLPFRNGSLAEDALHDDMMKSVLPWFVTLAENYNVLLYSGQLDIIIPYSATANFLKKMKWSGSKAFRTTRKKIWHVGNRIAGYSKTVRHRKNKSKLRFIDVLVRSAGHVVPQDQPKWALDMITRFTSNKRF